MKCVTISLTIMLAMVMLINTVKALSQYDAQRSSEASHEIHQSFHNRRLVGNRIEFSMTLTGMALRLSLTCRVYPHNGKLETD